MTSCHTIGSNGEAFAKRALEKKGYRVIATNVRGRQGELDIIALRRRCLVFCEVKTRKRPLERPGDMTDALMAVGASKQQRLRRAASEWLSRTDLAQLVDEPVVDIRFDVIAVQPDSDGRLRVRHIENAL